VRQVVIMRKLSETQTRLVSARAQLSTVEEQFAAMDEAAESLRIRNLVTETPQSDHDYREMRRSADVLAAARDRLIAQIADLEATRDRLLDKVEVPLP
jgi:uncharacterized coiled-coil DUF342 family protein